MSYISMLLLVVAATADSFIIGFNYGVKSVRISALSNIIIAALCFSGTFASMLLGGVAARFLDGFADAIGGAVLTLLGIYMLVSALDRRKSKKEHVSENPEAVDTDNSKVIEAKESLLIGFLLSLNNMGLGVGAGIAGFSLLFTPLACGLCSLLFICAGRFLGGKITRPRLSRVLETACASLVIALGVYGLTQGF